MDLKTVRQECSFTVGTGLKSFGVEVVECVFVVLIDGIGSSSAIETTNFDLVQHVVKLFRSSWARTSLLWRFLKLLVLPFFLTAFQMNRQTLRSKLSAAYIAGQTFGFACAFLHLLFVLLLFVDDFAFLATFQMYFETIWQESPRTTWARHQTFCII